MKYTAQVGQHFSLNGKYVFRANFWFGLHLLHSRLDLISHIPIDFISRMIGAVSYQNQTCICCITTL